MFCFFPIQAPPVIKGSANAVEKAEEINPANQVPIMCEVRAIPGGVISFYLYSTNFFPKSLGISVIKVI